MFKDIKLPVLVVCTIEGTMQKLVGNAHLAPSYVGLSMADNQVLFSVDLWCLHQGSGHYDRTAKVSSGGQIDRRSFWIGGVKMDVEQMEGRQGVIVCRVSEENSESLAQVEQLHTERYDLPELPFEQDKFFMQGSGIDTFPDLPSADNAELWLIKVRESMEIEKKRGKFSCHSKANAAEQLRLCVGTMRRIAMRFPYLQEKIPPLLRELYAEFARRAGIVTPLFRWNP